MSCFYENGLRFSCTGCGHCCGDEPGYVYLSKNDLQALSGGLGMDENQFIEVYCRKIDHGPYYMVALREKSNFDCVFKSGATCMVYSTRPKQCRTYPFWEPVMQSAQAWNLEASQCPGINQGQLHSKKEINDILRKHPGDEPLMIFK